ncbi:MAG: M1 family metallopeptidase [Deltaproteobacteria bacterium]|nr:MAG: M1 family metallopeptidase [Deltaproteobacteria bacterium]
MAIAGCLARAHGMRALAVCAALAGCGRPDVPAAVRGPGRPAAPAIAVADAGAMVPATAAAADAGSAAAADAGSAVAAGLRLGEDAAPVAYDLTLDLDPDRATFTGHVAITIAVAAPVTRLWLHAVDLDIASARLQSVGGDAPAAVIPGSDGSEMLGFAPPHPIDAGTAVLVIDYTGRVADLSRHAGKDEQGLFRERAGGRWYLYSQAESVFARRIVPCFDEPRWKPRWRLTAIVPRGLAALGNAAVAAERELPDHRREVQFAEIAALPSYLFAVAVGPFELVDAGRLGDGHIPARLAVAAGDGKRAALALRELPRIVDALERYIAAPLPLAKLDLVAVPEFFGAMENPGLITFQTGVLVGGRDFTRIAAHELAHQWFGNAVTPAWWDALWLSEAFASWLGDRVTGSLTTRIPALAHRGRLAALEADDRIDAEALIHPVATSGEVEPAFDAILYDKGAAVLAMFERFVGRDTFQAAVRSYLATYTGRSVTTRQFLDALGAAARPAVAEALASNLRYAGTPAVELSLRCGAAPALVASARDRVAVPVCVRFPAASGGAATQCVLAGSATVHPLPAATGCPAWLIGNDGGLGYYRTVWRGPVRLAPLALLSPDEQLARADDVAFAVRRGELAAAEALTELAAFAALREPHATLAALEIAGAIDAMVGDPVRPAWTSWLAGQLGHRMTRDALLAPPRSVAEYIARAQIVELVRGEIDPDVVAEARARIDRLGDVAGDPARLRIAAARDAGALFERLVRAAATVRTGQARDQALEALGDFPAPLAPRVVDVLLDARFPTDRVWPAVATMLARGETRSAAWRALHARFARVLAALPPARARDALEALAGLCDPGARAELAADAAPVVPAAGDARRTLDRTLAVIDRCVARRAMVGDIAAALAAVPRASGL